MSNEEDDLERMRVEIAQLRAALQDGLDFWNDEDGDNLAEWRAAVRKLLAVDKST